MSSDSHPNQENPLSQQIAPQSDAELSRLHPISLLFDIISHSRTYLIPTLFALFSAAKGNTLGVIVAGLIFVPALTISIMQYFTLRYSIRNRQLIVTKGLIFRSIRTVPVTRIQNIDSVQNVLHRIFGVAEVRVETASGTEPEAKLRVLSLKQLERLRSEIFDLQDLNDSTDTSEVHPQNDDFQAPLSASTARHQPTVEHAEMAQSTAVRSAEQTILKIPTRDLIIAGLTSNRGLIMIGVVVGLFFQLDLEKYIDLKQLEKIVPQNADPFTLAWLSIVGFVMLLALLRLLGIGWYILRFFDYRLIRRGDDLRLSCGLLTKVSATVPRGRVQFISMHRNLLMRWLGYATIRIETAGGAGKNHEDATQTISRRWFVPIIPQTEIPRLLAELRPGLEWDETKLDFQPLSSRASHRLARLAVIASLLTGVIGFGFQRPWGWTAGLIALPIYLAWAMKKAKSMRYARMAGGVVYRSGVLNRKTSMTFFERIQTVRVDQTPFDRRWRMAQLSVDTAAAGPAEHRIMIPLLDEEFAFSELEQLRAQTASHQPVFR